MRPLKEGTPHELYLHASSAAKPMAPLKLYANVTGKFTVERELGEKVQDRIRESTLGAVKQRSERKTILIDTPPDLHPVHGKKRKAPTSSMFRKPVQQSDHLRNNAGASTAALPARVSSPVPSQQTTKEGLIPVRKRLIHCLAVSERSSDEVIQLVGGSDCDPSLRREVLGLLDEVIRYNNRHRPLISPPSLQLAEQTAPVKKSADKSPKSWCLKPKSWLEVRPYEWPKLTDPERTTMARVARLAYKNLNIPETDPAWRHVRYRNGTNPNHGAPPPSVGSSRGNATITPNGTSNVTAQGGAKTDAPKRGVTSKEAKEKKAKPRADPKAEILMKDESRKPSSRASNTTGNARDDSIMPEGNSTATSKATAAARRAPGSGFKVAKSMSQDEQSDSINGPSPPRGKPLDVRVKDKEQPPPSLPTKPTQPIPPHVGRERKSGVGVALPTRVKKLRDSTADSDRERGRDREREREQDRGGDRERRKDKDEAPSVGLKRKKQPRNEDDLEDAPLRTTVQKRRKTDESVRPVTSSSERRARDLSLPKKPDMPGLPPRSKVTKNELSPIPVSLPKIKKDPSSLLPRKSLPSHGKTSSVSSSFSQNHPNQSYHNSSTSSKTNGAAKSRRRSPIYTSSEDEGEIRPPNKRDATSGPLPTPPNTTHSHSQPHPHPRVHPPRPPPTDHAALRARYHSSYVEYITTFQKVVTQRGKIESLLKSNGSGSVGSITDSDEELMDVESLTRLNAEHRKLQDELENIQRIFSRSGDGGSGSD